MKKLIENVMHDNKIKSNNCISELQQKMEKIIYIYIYTIKLSCKNYLYEYSQSSIVLEIMFNTENILFAINKFKHRLSSLKISNHVCQ